MAKTKEIALGSGKVYIYEAPTNMQGELEAIPADATIETEEHEIGHISGGASLSYSFETFSVMDDLGESLYNSISSEEVIFKTGVLSWNLENMERLSAGATIEEGEGKRTLKIGGFGEDLKRHLIRFVHTMPTGKKIRVTLIGVANSGFELVFDPENPLVIDSEFKAVRQNDGKTLVIIEQEVDAE